MLQSPIPGASRRLIAAFVLLLLLPAAAVVWLGVQFVIQDQERESDQLRKRREGTAAEIGTRLRDRLSASEADLASGQAPGDDGVVLVIGGDGIKTRPDTPLLYYPGLAAPVGEPPPELAPAEALEHRRGDLRAAEARYRMLASGDAPALRAPALAGLARVLRRQGRREQALRVYDDLARLDARLDGVPAALVAHRARCVTLLEMKQTAPLGAEAAALRERLLAGEWKIDRGTFDQYIDEISQWLGAPVEPPRAHQALSEAAARLWTRRGTNGRAAEQLAGIELVMLWRSSETETLALVAGPDYQRRRWFSTIAGEPGGDLRIRLRSPTGLVFGTPADDRRRATFHQSASELLPWHVAVTSDHTSSVGGRRRLTILAGLGFLVLLVITGGYVVARAVSRELAVARLQSDFVASVSHEFRTPLTSLRQFTDLLTEADDMAPEKRRDFYAAQARATDRLQRLVESLLDFRRMEAGTNLYQRHRLPAATVVERVVADFRREAAGRGFEVAYASAVDGRMVEADPDALSLALWNLLDNAVKYSRDSRRVAVSLAGRNGSIEISVRDHGFGVPPQEQREIFRQFVRGREARALGIKGTGIGLTMVQRIVQAHGGRVTLESAPGEGSTFTIVLPSSS